MRSPRSLRLFVCATAAVLALALQAIASGPSDDWYLVTLAGQPCGFMHAWQSEIAPHGDQPALLEIGQEVLMRMGRAGETVTVRTKQTSRERFAGEQHASSALMVSAHMEAELGGTPMVTTWTFAGDKVLERVDAVRRKGQRESAVPLGEWLPPGAAQMTAESQRAAGAESITVKTLDFEAGLRVATLTSKRVAAGEIVLSGAAVPVTWWTTTSDLNSFALSEAFGPDGTLVQSKLPMEIGEIIMTRSTKESVLRQVSSSTAPDLLLRSLTPIVGSSARAIAQSSEATYLVSKAVPGSSHQQVVANDGSTWRINVRATAPLAKDLQPVPTLTEEARAACLESTALIDCDDERVRRATTKTLEGAPPDNTAHRAELLRRSVYAILRRKDLASALASASDAIVSRAGDCTEHAVLLAAMLRADGIPSRVACGVVSAESFAGQRDVFAWHMWTQAWIDGRWVDLDATLPDRAFHPGHILCSVTPLSGGVMDPAIVELTAIIGSLKIEVVDVR
ncbi:MAG: transglutaminase domain-containing protein [Planctomycetota bacterium]|nr:transglutaminase domain-containing protein [Planctomycetota bacterium]MDA1105239.1 transglutaminase domain-containing protein [Planctomycetota bacterium]